MVTAGYTLCDVGTDHGYVPIALVQGNIIPKAIAVDINKGPLERANEHIRANGLTEQITTRLSNGLEAIHDGEVDSIVIAGMGGELVIHILTAGETVCRSAKELILQPQSEVSKVREYVRNTGYKIVDEDNDFGGRKILSDVQMCAVCGQFRMGQYGRDDGYCMRSVRTCTYQKR